MAVGIGTCTVRDYTRVSCSCRQNNTAYTQP